MIVEEKLPKIKEKISASSKNLHLSLLREGRAVYLNARGMSMYPFLKTGDRIKIENVNKKEEIKIGDIVAVDTKNRNGAWFFVHRVVKIVGYDGKMIYFTKGDAHNKGLDSPVTRELIAGKITQIQRKGLKINLELTRWVYFNSIIAKLSFKYPRIIISLSRYINLIIEWRAFLSKVKNRFKKGNPLLYNTEELLFICARKDLNERFRKKAIELIKEGLDWKWFCEYTVRGGVVVLVYNALQAIAPYVLIPQFVLDRLKSNYIFIVSKNICQYKELIGLLKLFAQKNISLVPLKGLPLSKRLYGDIVAHGLAIDFDFLIEEKNKEPARILLEEAGYSLSPDNEISQWRWQYLFWKPKAVMIDLHWDITIMGRSDERIKGLWKSTSLVEEDGIRYYEFKEEELLLYLSTHLASSSCFRNLRRVCDINELLYRYKDTLDWEGIIGKAKSWRLANSLYATLKLSKVLFNSDIPLRVLERLRPNFLTLLLIKIFVNKKVILRNGIRKRLIGSFLSYIFFELIEAQSPKEYFSIFKRVFFPPKEVRGNRSCISRIFKGLLKLSRNIID
jgi:signal peptidase I